MSNDGDDGLGGAASWARGAQLSRRQLLKTLGGGMLVMTAGGTLLDACSSTSTKKAASGSTTKSTSSETATLTVLIHNDPIALDPIKYNAGTIERPYRQVVETLYEWTIDKKIVPLLAAAMPTISSDQLTYTVPLRTDVTFHNGKSFGADDVVYTYEQCMDPKNSSIWLPNLGKVKSVTAKDAHTVVVELTEVFTPTLSAMALIPIVPSNVPYNDKTYARSLIGTGPFVFDRWDQGVGIYFSKNKKYWQAGYPKVDKLVFKVEPSDATQIAELVGGTAQMMAKVASKDVGVIKSRGGQVFVLENSSIIDYMYPNVQAGRWTADVNARLAIAWAMDRSQVLQTVFNGIGVPESTLPAKGAQYYDATLGQFFGSKPDLAKAKAYLAKAGGPPSKPLELVVLGGPVATPTAPIVQENLAAIGIKSNISDLGENPALAALFAEKFDLFLLEVTAQQSTGFGSYIAYLAVYPGAFANFNKFNDPTMTALASKAVSVTSDAEQAAAWKAVQQEWVKQVPQILLCTSHYIEAGSKSLTGYQPVDLCQLWNLKSASVG
jgi:peptide/nickel transport system substrate-binding protein